MNHILISSNIFDAQGAWNDHYSGFELNKIYTSENVTQRKELENANIYVHSSLFKDIISTGGSGGVFYLMGGTSNEKLLFESIFFVNCSTTGHGGCVYISSSGNNIFSKVCVYHCGTTSGSTYSGQIYFSNADCTDKLLQVSGEGCGYGMGCWYTFYLSPGTNNIHSVNVSESYCEFISGMLEQSNSHKSFSTFTNNTATEYTCIYFYSSNSGNNDMSYCNVISNTQGTSSCGTILSEESSTTSILDSVFIGNLGGYLFYRDSGSGTFRVSNCHIGDNQGSLSLSYSVTVSNTVSFANIPMSIHCNIVDEYETDNNDKSSIFHEFCSCHPFSLNLIFTITLIYKH